MKYKYLISNMLIDEVNKLFSKKGIDYTLDKSPIPLHAIIETDLDPDNVYALFQTKPDLAGEYKNDYIPVIKDLNKTCSEITHIFISNRAKFLIIKDE